MKKLKKRERMVFFELMKDARQSDREMGRKLGLSQPTVTRIRQKLERNGLIKKYSAIPDLSECGFKIFVATVFQWNDFTKKSALKQLESYLNRNPYVILYGRGEGMQGSTMIILSIHPDYESFNIMITQIRDGWDEHINNMHHFFASAESVKKGGDVTRAVMSMFLP